MPIKTCYIHGKKGWKYGDVGTCYTGPTGKARAQAQAFAIGASRARSHGVRGSRKVSEAAGSYLSKEAHK